LPPEATTACERFDDEAKSTPARETSGCLVSCKRWLCSRLPEPEVLGDFLVVNRALGEGSIPTIARVTQRLCRASDQRHEAGRIGARNGEATLRRRWGDRSGAAERELGTALEIVGPVGTGRRNLNLQLELRLAR